MTRLACLSLLLSAGFGFADEPTSSDFQHNWHQWRGPNADGTAPNADPPIAWSETSGIRWKVPVAGEGSATPAIWKDQIFVLSAVPTDRQAETDKAAKDDPAYERKTEAPTNYYKFIVQSFDRNTGKLRWERLAAEAPPHEGKHQTHTYAAGSPTTDGKRLYASFGSRGVFAYDLDGNLLWKREFGLLRTRFGWGEAVTPVIHGDSLILNWDQEIDAALICLDAVTGKTKWQVRRDEKSTWSTPLVVEQSGRTQVVTNGTTKIRSYDLKDGGLIWECGGMTVNPIPSPVAAGGIVYCLSGFKGAAGAAISLDAKGDVSNNSSAVKWRVSKGTPYVPSPLLLKDRLWFTQANTNILTSLDTANGEPVINRARLQGEQNYYSSPIAAAGRIYFAGREGTTTVIEASDTLKVLAVNKLNDGFDASPVAVGKKMYLRGAAHLYCIETTGPETAANRAGDE